MNILLSSVGRRPYLVRWFKEALVLNGISGKVIAVDLDPHSPARVFADDFFRSETPWPQQLKAAYNETGKSVISLINVDKKDADKYGMASLSDQKSDRLFKLSGLLEKPGEENAPSTFASVGSYLLTPEIWPYLEQEKVGKGGEISLSESISELAAEGEAYGYFIDGVWHDTGDQLKYIKAVIDLALESEEYGEDLRAYLDTRLGQ